MSGVASHVGALGFNPALGFQTRPRRVIGVVGAAAWGTRVGTPIAAAPTTPISRRGRVWKPTAGLRPHAPTREETPDMESGMLGYEMRPKSG